jgi:hypothetical protein
MPFSSVARRLTTNARHEIISQYHLSHPIKKQNNGRVMYIRAHLLRKEYEIVIPFLSINRHSFLSTNKSA